MTLIQFDQVDLEFGDQPLLRQAQLAVETGERVCLVGRNGAGKSSLFKLITGEHHPDGGEIQRKSGLRISELRQTLPDTLDHSVREVVSSGLAEMREFVDAYHSRSSAPLDHAGLLELAALERQIEAGGGWDIRQRVDTIISELDLPADQPLHALSGGWRRRVALARALVSDPELLLLDEPTNHLDLSTIEWLEDRIFGFRGSVLFITHDRAFVKRLATRIIELDRGRLTSWPGNYSEFVRLKEKALVDEKTHNAEFDRKLAQEETWIRQGIKARRRRNEGRVRALAAMREKRAQRMETLGRARIDVERGEQSGRKVIEARNISHGFHDRALISDFSIKVMRGDRIGLIGNNGVGKSTLLHILLGEIEPQQGSVKLGTNLQIGYFDQLRRQLDPNKTVAETVGDGRDHININGKDRHVIGYLKGFLFSPKRIMSPVKSLSGGECNRIILAKLFTQASNLLVLDEPTNDLDVETLEVLEARLVEYRGTLIVVSHDREFLDNVVTSTLVFESESSIREYVGGFSDWLRRGRSLQQVDGPEAAAHYKDQTKSTKSRNNNKLSYKLKVELDQIPDTIESLEKEIAVLQEQTADPDFYNQGFEKVQPILALLDERQARLERTMDRWSELETLAQEVKAR